MALNCPSWADASSAAASETRKPADEIRFLLAAGQPDYHGIF
jgi:hypothetical protein